MKTHHDLAEVSLLCTSSPNYPTFTAFPRLPSEIRYKIWVYAHPDPRNVIISLGRFQHKSAINPPALSLTSGFAHMLVNHEASEIFSKHYPKIFVGYQHPKPSALGDGGWYFNYEIDSLCMESGLRGMRYFLRRFPENIRRVRYLNIGPDPHEKRYCGGSRTGWRTLHDMGFFGWGHCEFYLRDMKDLRLVTVRCIVDEWLQWTSVSRTNTGKVGARFRDTIEVLEKCLKHKDSLCYGRSWCVELATQFTLEPADPALWSYFTVAEYQDCHWDRKPLTDEVRERWSEMGIRPPETCPPNLHNSEVDLHFPKFVEFGSDSDSTFR